MTHEEVKKFISNMADAWNARDLDRDLSFLTQDVVWRDPAMVAPAENLTAVRTFSQSVMRAFPDFHYAIRDPLCVRLWKHRSLVPLN